MLVTEVEEKNNLEGAMGKWVSRRGRPEVKALGHRKGREQGSGSTQLKSKVTVNEEKRKGKSEFKLTKRKVPMVKSYGKVADVSETEY